MWQTLRRDAAPSTLLAAVLALLVGFSGPFLIIVHAAQSAGLSQGQLASWVWAVSIGSGAAGLWLSLRWKTPVIAAWSTPGAALLLAGLPGVPYPEAVGAFLAAAAIVTLVGVSGLFDRLMALFPPALAAALLAGILFHFVGEVVAEATGHLGLVLAMAALFFIGRRWFPRWALLAAIAAGAVLSAGELHAPAAASLHAVAAPLFTWPAWSWSAFVNLALPLALLALTSQFLPGMAVLRAFGYQVPARSPVTALGLASMLTAPFGGHGVTLAAIRRAGGAGAGLAQALAGDGGRPGAVRHAGLIAGRGAGRCRAPRVGVAHLRGGGLRRQLRRPGRALVGDAGRRPAVSAAEPGQTRAGKGRGGTGALRRRLAGGGRA
ncbi:benzoate/H(+) symporter BenE family transporter [Chromobacterium piscinae]|uniref:benzoate/H(+) symporter BenE family transporter n=1 Tax=Chromobacterium piscinae TaxID=686831 RepID=UPI003D15C2F5